MVAVLVFGPALATAARAADDAVSSASADRPALNGGELYRAYTCNSCHGDARRAPLPGIPRLNGQDQAYLIEQLRDFKRGARNNGSSMTMTSYVKTIPDEELVAITQYLSHNHPN
jgi:cytochrome c553